jgi:hypothetical protein
MVVFLEERVQQAFDFALGLRVVGAGVLPSDVVAA